MMKTNTQDQNNEDKRSEIQKLMDIVKPMQKTYDDSDIFIPVQFNRQTRRRISVKSRDFKAFLSKLYYDAYEKLPTERSLDQVVLYLLGEALEHQPENPKYRIKAKGGYVYYDLCRDEGFVKIGPEGCEIRSDENGLFKHYSTELEQAIPNTFDPEDLERLKIYINLTEKDWLLFTVYLISCFYPDIEHPIISVRGARGSGKSTILKILKSLIDPSSQQPGNLNQNMDSLQTLLGSCYYLPIDNLSKISARQSDIFCQAVTGGGYVKRELYTDKDIVTINFTALIAMNGILDVVHKDDLANRTVFFKTSPLTGDSRIVNNNMWNDFETEKPEILGAIFSILSKALTIYGEIDLPEYHRLGDFEKLGYAIAESIGEGLGEEFLEALKRNEQAQMDAVYEGTPLVPIVINFMSSYERWEGKMSTFYKMLFSHSRTEMDDEFEESDFPGNAASLGKQLVALVDVFANFGIDIEKTRDSNNCSYVTLVNTRYEEK